MTSSDTSLVLVPLHVRILADIFNFIWLGTSFQKMNHHILLHGSSWRTSLEKNLKLWWVQILTLSENVCISLLHTLLLDIHHTNPRLTLYLTQNLFLSFNYVIIHSISPMIYIFWYTTDIFRTWTNFLRVNVTFYDAVNAIHDIILSADPIPYTAKFMFDRVRNNKTQQIIRWKINKICT